MSEIKSYHIFMFPFRWDYIKKPKYFYKSSFEDRININKITDYLLEAGWKLKSDEIESSKDYNEKLYFYNNVRKAIYNQNNSSLPIVKNFVHSTNEKIRGKYSIYTKDKKYILNLERIALKIYETGVGILIYYLENTTYSDKEDIFKINEYGRRIYPQFINKDEDKRTEKTKGVFLASKIQIDWEDDKSPVTETFEWYDRIENVRKNPTKLPDTIIKILEGVNHKKYFIDNENEIKSSKNKIWIRPIIDDRMFVICLYYNDDWIEKLSKLNKDNDKYSYMEDDGWFKYIFVDGNYKCCTSRFMSENLLQKHTYERWISETLYGMSKYSFVVLSKNSEFADVLLKHVQTMYCQMIALILAQRASILTFSDEISSISTLQGKGLVERVRLLHKKYIQFVNKMYFREVTAQEQGIELYNQLVSICEIDRNIKDLDNEISELHEYATLEQESNTNLILHLLTIIGASFVIPSFFTGFFGMNIFGEINSYFTEQPFKTLEWYKNTRVWIWLTCFFSIPNIIVYVLYKVINRYKFRNKFDIIEIITIIIFLLPIILVFYFLFIYK